MTNNDRWQFAIHEASHAIAIVALQGRCVSLFLGSDGGGLCQTIPQFPSDAAFCSAAGPIGQEMYADAPAPENVPQPLAAKPQAEPKTFETIVEHHAVSKSIDSDETAVRRWACSSGEPERWHERYYWAMEVARRIVADNRETILAVARSLYHRHHLEGDEVHQIFEAIQ